MKRIETHIKTIMRMEPSARYAHPSMETRFRTGYRWLPIVIGLMACCTGAIQAQSATPDFHDDLQSLQTQLDQLKSSYGIQRASGTMTIGHSISCDSVPCECPCGSNPAAQTGPGCLPSAGAAATKDSKYPTVRLTGFFQTDAGWFRQDAANIAAVGDIQDGADFRRARLAATGDVWDNVGYMVEFDFAFPGRPNFMDVWLELRDLGPGNLRIGQFRHPFGMDGLTGVKDLTFLERGLPFAFLPFRQIGAMYYGQSEDELVTWAVSGFRFPTDPYGGNVGDNGGYSMATRLTGLLLDNGDDGVLHIGGGYSYGDPANDLVRYQNTPEFFVSETGGAALVPAGVPSNVPPFVDTGLIPTQNFHLANAELGASMGSFHAQSEVFFASINQTGGPRTTFNGAYAQAGYILTGETRPYNRKAGVFGRIVPKEPFGKCGCGAWEVAGRWSYIDLNDANIQGGRLTDVTLGLNWYLNQYTKFQFNYIHAMLDSSPAAAGPIVNDSNADIVAVRAQIDF